MINAIPDEVVLHVRGLARDPLEVCGLVYMDGETALVYPVPNVADEPWHAFEMDPRKQMLIMNRHRRMPDFIYHTHPGGSFDLSSTDRASLPPTVGLILGVPDGRVGLWRVGELVSTYEH